jgi:hypothetical protein
MRDNMCVHLVRDRFGTMHLFYPGFDQLTGA